ncbi:glycerophosphodiester phosphodiesterase [Vibrio lamellibrachiae]|uniref:glycerophosphodiester phosphodiesterase n=1 Tax=Vibrio lamellibrachiae TaxID=2910253 RepID=UPI003D100B7A
MCFTFDVAQQGKVLINSHRGDSLNCPENTMPAFVSALEAKTSCIEIDIAMTSDNHLVVIHDPSIDRTSNGKGYVEQMTLAELQQFDYGHWFSATFENTKILEYRTLLNWAIKNDVGLVVETKQRRRHQEFAEVFVALMREVPDAISHVQLLGFDHTLVNRAKLLLPELKIQVVTLARYKNQIDAVIESNADCVCFEYPHAHIDDLRAYKAAGLCTRLYLPTKEIDTTEWFNEHFGYDVHSEIIEWLKLGLIDMISHDDIEMLKRLAKQADLIAI